MKNFPGYVYLSCPWLLYPYRPNDYDLFLVDSNSDEHKFSMLRKELYDLTHTTHILTTNIKTIKYQPTTCIENQSIHLITAKFNSICELMEHIDMPVCRVFMTHNCKMIVDKSAISSIVSMNMKFDRRYHRHNSFQRIDKYSKRGFVINHDITEFKKFNPSPYTNYDIVMNDISQNNYFVRSPGKLWDSSDNKY
jgi:hypothetical protein